MYFLIFMIFPLISTRKTDRIKRNHEQNDYDEYSGDYDIKYLNSQIVYDNYYYNYHNYNDYYNYNDMAIDGEIRYPCKVDEYEIIVEMGSELFSGTDDKVEIRLYGIHREVSEWLEFTEPIYTSDGFERLAQDVYCVKAENIFKKITMIGIRKFGTDDMKIDTIVIRNLNEDCNGVYQIDQWIKKEGQYIFEALRTWCGSTYTWINSMYT